MPAASAKARSPRAPKPRELPEWTQEVLPPLKANYSQIPNRIRDLKRKLDGLPYMIVETVAFETWGGRIDEKYGVDPVDRDRRRPKWAPISMKQFADENVTTVESAQATIDELVEMGLLLRSKVGRDAWYALDLSVIDTLKDRKPRQVERKAPVEEPVPDSTEAAVAEAEVFRLASWGETIAPRVQMKPREIPRVSEQVQFVNEGTVPVEVVSRVAQDSGNVWEIRFKAFVETEGLTQQTASKKASIPELEFGYSYSFKEFQGWLLETWSQYGFAERLGVWPDEEVSVKTYRALKGAELQHFSVVLANYSPRGGNPRKANKMQSPGFLPHVAKECADHKDRWSAKVQQQPVPEEVHEGPSALELYLEQNPEARKNWEYYKSISGGAIK